MGNFKTYKIKLEELLSLQKNILNIVKKGEIVPKEYFEKRTKITAELSVLNAENLQTEEIAEIKNKIIEIEKEILKEAKKILNITKIKILQHEKSTANMINYFKSQIQSHSEIDINI